MTLERSSYRSALSIGGSLLLVNKTHTSMQSTEKKQNKIRIDNRLPPGEWNNTDLKFGLNCGRQMAAAVATY